MDFNPLWIVAFIVAAGALVGIGVWLFGIGKWVGAVDNDRESFKTLMKEIRQKLDSILERLPSPKVVQESSPVQLTEFGTRIANAASTKEWAANHAQELLDAVRGKEEFEVFELCKDYVARQVEEDEASQRAMRKVAYDFGLEVEQIRKVYEVELRDCVLARRSS